MRPVIIFCCYLLVLLYLPACSQDVQKLEETNICINCDLSWQDFEQMNLSNANLKNANLTGSRFFKTNLTNANLEGAIIYRANFSQAILDNARWIDGKICQKGSIGTCLK